MGLSHRYGRRMQTISGIHYNFSCPTRSNDDYFALIRNFRRHACCCSICSAPRLPSARASLPTGRTSCSAVRRHAHLPHATSLRMGRLSTERRAGVAGRHYNNLKSYAASLQEALTAYPAYAAIVRDGDEYRQPTTCRRSKMNFTGPSGRSVINPGERPPRAARPRVEYVEVRLMDLDPSTRSASRRARCACSMYSCCIALIASPDTPQGSVAVGNKQRVASRGRRPGLRRPAVPTR
jgi:glutamate--cysteine ligase